MLEEGACVSGNWFPNRKMALNCCISGHAVSAFGSGNLLPAGGSQVPFPMFSLEF